MIASKQIVSRCMFALPSNHGIYQEERVCKVGVDKDQPANPAAGTLAAVKDLGNDNSDNDPDKLVPRIGNQVKELGLARDAQEVASQLQEEDLNDDNN